MARDSSPPTSSHAAMQRTGLTRLPPARRVAHRLVDLERLAERHGGVEGSVDGLGFAEDVRHEIEGGGGGFEVAVFFGDEGRGNGVRNGAFWGEGDGFKGDEGMRSGSGCFGLGNDS
ncbi:Uncharacterized protein Rs2_08533 [Raphanus sativus]|nr:Uncharacterized protein Rs2_08533 [Raphanus sativus]